MSGSCLDTNRQLVTCDLTLLAFGLVVGVNVSLLLYLLNLSICSLFLACSVFFLWAYLEIPKLLSEVKKACIFALREEKVTIKEIVHHTGCEEATIRCVAAAASRLPPCVTPVRKLSSGGKRKTTRATDVLL